jgi:hypothetical protein
VIQLPYFVHKAHYFFTPFKAFMPGIQNSTSAYLLDEHERTLNSLVWVFKLPNGLSVKPMPAAASPSMSPTSLPPPMKSGCRPPKASLSSLLLLQARRPSRRVLGLRLQALVQDVNHFAETSKSIKEAVAGLIAPTDSDLDKARSSIKPCRPRQHRLLPQKTEAELKQLKLKAAKHAEDTWNQKSGDSEDIALLYLAMLRAAGLTAYAKRSLIASRASSTPLTFLCASSTTHWSFSAPAARTSNSTPAKKCAPSAP